MKERFPLFENVWEMLGYFLKQIFRAFNKWISVVLPEKKNKRMHNRKYFEKELSPQFPILWPPDMKSWFIGKDPDAGKYWRQNKKRVTEDEMAGWHHRLDGHEFGWTPGIGDGQGGLVCCNHGVTVRYDWATELNWTKGRSKTIDFHKMWLCV